MACLSLSCTHAHFLPLYLSLCRYRSGMDVVDRFYAGYGDVFPKNDIGPHTHKIEEQGNEYLSNEFPLLSYFTGQVLSRKMIFCTWMTNMYLIMNVKACKLLQTLSSLN
mmetsp:Transcript_1100/g.1792  ORF Transcript_1100/g.1792 Transcript_1100/m.1792 type:complete len:109 (-) Transcript_1100:156-482(-)